MKQIYSSRHGSVWYMQARSASAVSTGQDVTRLNYLICHPAQVLNKCNFVTPASVAVILSVSQW